MKNKIDKYRCITRKHSYCLPGMAVFLMCAVLFFSACYNPFNPSSLKAPEGTGSVTFVLGVTNGRTILPVADLSKFAAFTFDFYDIGDIDVAGSIPLETREYLYNGTSYTMALPDGDYDLLVSAWTDSAKTKLAAQGRLEGAGGAINVDGTLHPHYSVTLEALISGGDPGTFSWKIKFPAGLTSAKMDIVDPSTPAILDTVDFPSDGSSIPAASFIDTSTASTAIELDPGYYSVIFELDRDDGQQLIFREILHIYQNLNSVFDYEFTDAHFTSLLHTVTFVYDDGKTPNEIVKDCLHGYLLTETDYTPVYYKPVPAGLYKPALTSSDCVFGGWFSKGVQWNFANPVTGDMTLTAQWTAPNNVDVSGETGANDVIKAMNFVTNPLNADPLGYTLLVGPEGLDPDTVTSVNIGSHTLGAGCILTIEGMGDGERILMGATATDPLFYISGAGTKLTLGKNISLYGIPNSDQPLVGISDGDLIMEEGSKITGHTTSSSYGAVYIETLGLNARFIMKGGEITGNKSTSTSAQSTGGLYVENFCTFNMEGGR
ncbi:MAG: hypothetical protein LBI04_04735, partial [Treponema sp.]|nr:hypothetical protein [Treponema sp.]